jgi:hypothetical protein
MIGKGWSSLVGQRLVSLLAMRHHSVIGTVAHPMRLQPTSPSSYSTGFPWIAHQDAQDRLRSLLMSGAVATSGTHKR